MNRRPLAIVAAAALALGLAGCSEPTPAGTSSSAAASSTAALSGSITVDAAASLREVFPELAKQFEAEHPGTTVSFNFGGSSDLAAAIIAGAPIDVFAAASSKTMGLVTTAQLTSAAPVTIARNKLEIVVPKNNPGDITGLNDFGDASKTTVVCAPAVPCGAAAVTVFTAAGVTAKPKSYEKDVTSVLTKVETGNADAGLVYQTDVQAAGTAVKGIPFPEADEAITAYPIAPLSASRNAALASAFVDYVVKNGSTDLLAAGFLAPQ